MSSDTGHVTSTHAARRFRTGYQVHQESYGAMKCLQFKGYPMFEIVEAEAEFRDNSDYDQRLSLAYALGCAVDSDSRDMCVHDDFEKLNGVNLTRVRHKPCFQLAVWSAPG